MRGDCMMTVMWQSKDCLPISFLVSFLRKKPSIFSWVHIYTEYRVRFLPFSSNKCDHWEQRSISKMSLVISLKRGVRLVVSFSLPTGGNADMLAWPRAVSLDTAVEARIKNGTTGEPGLLMHTEPPRHFWLAFPQMLFMWKKETYVHFT